MAALIHSDCLLAKYIINLSLASFARFLALNDSSSIFEGDSDFVSDDFSFGDSEWIASFLSSDVSLVVSEFSLDFGLVVEWDSMRQSR